MTKPLAGARVCVVAVVVVLVGCAPTVNGSCDLRKGPNGQSNTSAIAQTCTEYVDVDFGESSKDENIEVMQDDCEDKEGFWKEDGKCKGDPIASCTHGGGGGTRIDYYYEGYDLNIEGIACEASDGSWKTY